MNSKISKIFSKFLSSKGMTHEEEQVVEEYRCSSEELHRYQTTAYHPAKPKEDPNGDAVFTKKANVSVDDELSDQEVDLLFQLNQDEQLDTIGKELKSTSAMLAEKLDVMEGHLKIMKYCILAFAVLTGISLIISIVSVARLSSLSSFRF
ncbi:MAG: hypothetical protein KH334_04145 [Clostridiales bacterium]|nr:hypothetical protein [Clostridiales bacterium]